MQYRIVLYNIDISKELFKIIFRRDLYKGIYCDRRQKVIFLKVAHCNSQNVKCAIYKREINNGVIKALRYSNGHIDIKTTLGLYL